MKEKCYKKLVKTLAGLVAFSSFLSCIGCANIKTSIHRPNPILPINKKGFSDVNLDKIEIASLYYNDDLISQINTQIELAGYDMQNIKYEVYRNQNKINMNDDLYRNGTYRFEISNTQNFEDHIQATIIITNSNHLEDIFKVRAIGEIYDNRPKTILMALMFYNMNMISKIDLIGEQLEKVENYKYLQEGVNICLNDVIPTNKPTSFYGSIDLLYTVKPFIEDDENFPLNIEKFVELATQNTEPKLNLGKLNSTNKYVVLMQFITDNLANPNYWSLFINDLDLDSIASNEVGQNEYEMRIYSKIYKEADLPTSPEDQNKTYDENSHFLDDQEGVVLKFQHYS